MKILDRYIGMAVVGGTLTVMAILLALFSFFTFIGELEDVGTGNYGLWKAAEYVVLKLPLLSYQLFPLSALLGSLIGLGILASHSELTVVRAAGVSMGRIVMSVMKVGVLLMLLMIIIGEMLASKSEQYAQDMRSSAIAKTVAQKTKDGFWTREKNNYINVRAIYPGGNLGGIHVYEFDRQQRLQVVTSARAASFQNGSWILKGVARSVFGEQEVISEKLEQMEWRSLMLPEMLDIIAIKPESLSAWGLYQYVLYLKSNNLNPERYEMELWRKLVLPFATAVMVFLSIPFVFGSLRSVSVGLRVMVGVLIGIGFYIINQIFSYTGLVYGLNPFASAILPTLLFFALAVHLMRRVF